MMQPLALGIDIGGTNTSFGLIDAEGNIFTKGDMPTVGHNNLNEYIATLKSKIQPLFDRVGKSNIVGVGIGAPNGNLFTGEIVFAPNLPWKGVIPFAKMITEAVGIKATLTNDANAAAVGEMMYGAAKGMKDFIVITLGTGLGSGFVANGNVIYGHDSFAGELGHVIAVRDGRMCGCGRKGCLETYVSATGIVRTAELWLKERSDDTILRPDMGHIRSTRIFNAAKQGDAFAQEIFEYTGKVLGQALADAVAITSPEAIILFGGLANAGDTLMEPTRRHMEDSMLRIFKNKVALIKSSLPDADAAILGASALAWQ